MAEALSLKQGERIVKLARKSIEYAIASGRPLGELCDDRQLLQERGVFVSLHSFPEKELRGCIGMPYALKQLWNAVEEMAVEAALNDPRFPPMKAEELKKTIVEVSVLSKPEEIQGKKRELHEKIRIGKDGIMVQRGHHSGLFLPQVAPEQKWGCREFVENCCRKAGLMESMWQNKETKIFKFQAQVFSEKEPNGKVEEKKF